MRFKLLAGKHSQKEEVRGQKGPDGKPLFRARIYTPGDIIETETDLVARFNSPGSMKFERVADSRSTRARAEGTPETRARTQELLPEEDPTEFPNVAAPGGQVSQGFPVAAPRGAAHQPGVPTLGEQAAQEARESEMDPAVRSEQRDRQVLQQKTVAELREVAEKEEVDLAGATRKDEIIDAILKG